MSAEVRYSATVACRCSRTLFEGFMRISRLFTATVVIGGVVIVAANPACSSSSSSTFGMDAGMDGTTLTDGNTTAPGQDGSPSDGKAPSDAHKDAPKMLGMPDAAKHEASTVTDAGFSDAKPDIGAEATTCIPDASATPGPVKHSCIIYSPTGTGDDGNECDGHHDPPSPFPPNGSFGNGFDDNCNGLVDEGCACQDVGTTKTCYLVPATQTVGGVPVGWCAQNSKGTVACSQQGEGSPMWNGVCRGAQPPYANDFCAPGDFNCDGKQENSTTANCSCTSGIIECPTDPLITIPYPPPSALPLQINAAPWFADPADVASATDWQWTLTGGDCDNILPHPSFGIYASSDGSGNPLGTQSNTLGMSGAEHGMTAIAPAVSSAIYPAFSLSGEYLVNASWMLNGKPYACSVKVEVVAPGIRAEGCWDTEGQGTTQDEGDDLDLHMAKVNDFPQCATSHSWSDLAPACSSANEDCFYDDCYAGGLFGTGTTDIDWGYVDSPASACNGWGSQSTGTSCSNPRLDRDANGLSGECDPTVTNPNGVSFNGPYCGPENINVDHPEDNDRFAVGLRFYTQNHVPPVGVHVHVNVYCDGVRVLSSGYDPTTTPPSLFPQLLTAGGDSTGDMWKVGLVTAQVTGAGLSCTVVPTQSSAFDPLRDGSSAFCVDDATLDGANSQVLLTSGGYEPANANALCFH
jgi:hypothetical protein